MLQHRNIIRIQKRPTTYEFSMACHTSRSRLTSKAGWVVGSSDVLVGSPAGFPAFWSLPPCFRDPLSNEWAPVIIAARRVVRGWWAPPDRERVSLCPVAGALLELSDQAACDHHHPSHAERRFELASVSSRQGSWRMPRPQHRRLWIGTAFGSPREHRVEIS